MDSLCYLQLQKKSILSDLFWGRVNGVLKLLQPVAQWITVIESDKPQLSLIARLFGELAIHFETTSTPLTKQQQKASIASLAARREFCLKNVHKAANLLDPRYIGKHLTEEDAVDACEFIANLAKCTDGISEDDVLADLANYRSKSGLWSKPFIWSSCHKIEPLVWWTGMCSGRPLSVVATKILSLPPTSAACERSFSTYSNVHTAKRNRLFFFLHNNQ